MKEQVFKFIIGKPTNEGMRNKYERIFRISCQTPIVYFPVFLKPNGDHETQIELAKNLLKVKMIEMIINGEWEHEK
jgi:hypothetical protein